MADGAGDRATVGARAGAGIGVNVGLGETVAVGSGVEAGLASRVGVAATVLVGLAVGSAAFPGFGVGTGPAIVAAGIFVAGLRGTSEVGTESGGASGAEVGIFAVGVAKVWLMRDHGLAQANDPNMVRHRIKDRNRIFT